jgi:hypothetical protein
VPKFHSEFRNPVKELAVNVEAAYKTPWECHPVNFPLWSQQSGNPTTRLSVQPEVRVYESFHRVSTNTYLRS